MADQQQGVRVSVVSAVSQMGDVTHPTGYRVDVHDGHLFVYDREDYVVAAYAPGKWNAATILHR